MKITIEFDEESGDIKIQDGGMDIVTILGLLEFAKHIVTHGGDADHSPEELSEKSKTIIMSNNKGNA